MPTIPPTVRRRVRRAGTAAAANIRSVPARRAYLRERTVVKNTIRRPATRSALGESTDAGNLGQDFAMMAGLVFVALMVEVIFLRPKTVMKKQYHDFGL